MFLIKKSVLCLIISAAFWSCPLPTQGQLELALNFERETIFFGGSPFRWFLFPVPFGVDGITVVSPGGTEITGQFSSATFDNFESFRNDVVGTWTIFFVSPEIQITFDIPSFEITDFPQFSITFPHNGDTFFSGQDIQTTIGPSKLEPFGNGSSIIGASEATVNFLGNNTFEIILDLDNPKEDVSLTRSVRVERPDLIQNIHGNVNVIVLSPLRLENESEPVDFNIVMLPGLGDVNLDGTVDLLDIGPFVELIQSGKFQIEADTNFDDVVNLQDIQSFVSLITGQ